MAFTEFCCKSGGSNLNAGTRTGNSTEPGTSADFTYASGTWVSATGVFTVASGDPSADEVAVGDFASVYADGASVTTLIGRVTARTSTTITVSMTAKAGTTTDGTSNRTLKIGGAWQGPNNASGFPSTLLLSSLTNTSSHIPRVNYKNDQTYSISAGIADASTAAFQGYASTYGDGGRATIQGQAGASFILWSTSGSNTRRWIADLIFDAENFTSGSSIGITVAQGNAYRCVVKGARGSGYVISTWAMFDECEAYNCNRNNSTLSGGFAVSNGLTGIFNRCISHHNAGSNTDGFWTYGLSSVACFTNCIAWANGKRGFSNDGGSNNSLTMFVNCDAYNNVSHGIGAAALSSLVTSIINCNLIKNGGYGISGINSIVQNCGFGSGTQANTSGTTVSTALETGSVTYASDVTPWTDPANGNFSIALAAAKAAGRGAFTQTQGGYSFGTVGYPDIGAAQAAASGGTTLIVIED